MIPAVLSMLSRCSFTPHRLFCATSPNEIAIPTSICNHFLKFRCYSWWDDEASLGRIWDHRKLFTLGLLLWPARLYHTHWVPAESELLVRSQKRIQSLLRIQCLYFTLCADSCRRALKNIGPRLNFELLKSNKSLFPSL